MADLVALAWFVAAWALYSLTLSSTEQRKEGLNSEMHKYRDVWMEQMLARETRMVDAQTVPYRRASTGRDPDKDAALLAGAAIAAR